MSSLKGKIDIFDHPYWARWTVRFDIYSWTYDLSSIKTQYEISECPTTSNKIYIAAFGR